MLRVQRVAKDISALPLDFWQSEHSELMVDERWAKDNEEQIQFLAEHLPKLSAHVWIASSGTLSTDSTWIALSKEALLHNAQAVNLHLMILPTDRWALTLPLSHVGGLSIHARTHLLQQKIDPLEYEWISLVPTQVFDIVKNKTQPPKTLRGAIVGGDAIDEDLYQKALNLGWPILRTYGMSELGSQLATEAVMGDGLRLLSHAQLKIEDSEALVASKCLFTLKIKTDFKTLTQIKRAGDWWPLPDLIELKEDRLTILGRRDNVIKVLGVKLDLTSLERELKAKLGVEVILRAAPDERRGQRIILFSEQSVSLEEVNRDLLGFQKISECQKVVAFPRTSLGKIKRGQLG
jgi:O-succinylbenzoic acid--CoA ligase